MEGTTDRDNELEKYERDTTTDDQLFSSLLSYCFVGNNHSNENPGSIPPP